MGVRKLLPYFQAPITVLWAINDLIFQAFIQLIIVCAQLLLMHNAKWDRLVSLCLEQFCGYWNLFRIVRNGLTGIENEYLILKFVFKFSFA